jgi:enoyl-CoA hydratase/carnithine racemase
MDSDEMLRTGFLDEVVPNVEALQVRIYVLADIIAGAPMSPVIVSMKQALNRIGNGDMESTAADAAWIESMRSPAVAALAAERIAARRQKKTDSGEESTVL